MEHEPIAWQTILLIISALGLVLWGFVQLTLNGILKRLTQIEILTQEFVTYKAVHDKTHEHIDNKILGIEQRVDEHDEVLEEHNEVLKDHDKKIDNLSQQIKTTKQQSFRKTTRKRNEKDIK